MAPAPPTFEWFRVSEARRLKRRARALGRWGRILQLIGWAVPVLSFLGVVGAVCILALTDWSEAATTVLYASFAGGIAWVLLDGWVKTPFQKAEKLQRRAHQLLSEHYQIHGSIPREE